jgi:hypothetical protein
MIGSGALFLASGGFCAAMQASSQSEQKSLQMSLAGRCAPALERARDRIFANPGSQSWKEFGDLKDMPYLDGNNGEFIFTIRTDFRNSFVHLMREGEDNSVSEENCFGASGGLLSLRYEMRTAWGWGYEDERSFSIEGKALHHRTRFFDTDSNKTIQRPRQADDVPGFLKPEIYRSLDSLPFSALLKKASVNAPQK